MLVLVKVNKMSQVEHKINVTLLDIDDLGSVVPVKDLELNLPPYDESVIQILKTSHVIIFTDDPPNGANPTIISAINLTDDELNQEKENMIKVANNESRKLE